MLTNVIALYIMPKSGAFPNTLIKYQGMAMSVIPCANPEIMFAVNKKYIAFLFFT